jgi:predicted nucleic acid-binding protein
MARSVVLDTSAVLAILVNEEHKPDLVRVTEGLELLAPSSLPAELGNAFSAMFKRGRISLEDAELAVAMFGHIPIRLTAIDLARALALSHRFRIYAYDAYAIVCGLDNRAPLLTIDAGQREVALQAGAKVLEISS